ncbi:acetoin utilization deacetylase AcuC-like enzyme [Inhella inkyongensis]|uniref:Acetoin utilization deacetylase AcuC-like enzyme n=1 Tax=Inhella inkyongensis TaxID=392593 RepID=A0A840SCF8_9BURK|nr:histone deacetylase family protein [Inhella inkyongensis]MBB5206131.1 acetoin utilization deacetylase AcuC-like enzyme [Inhella inkyongensis]
MGEGHPECPERLDAIDEALAATGLIEHLQVLQARPATWDELRLAHDPDYLDRLRERLSQVQGVVQLDPDTAANEHSLSAALHAAGAALQATQMVIAGKVDNAFCAVRPPGHHATRAKAMGFCFLSNVALAARAALRVHGLQRVAVVDFDVHHGNGTEDVLADDPGVLMVGLFEHPLYPFSGLPPKGDNMLNLPLPAHTGGQEIREMIRAHWLPALERFKPQMLFISAGFDAHELDPLGLLRLTEVDYAWITEQLLDVAARHAQGRIVSCLEGGYHRWALARSVCAHLRVLAKL